MFFFSAVDAFIFPRMHPGCKKTNQIRKLSTETHRYSKPKQARNSKEARLPKIVVIKTQFKTEQLSKYTTSKKPCGYFVDPVSTRSGANVAFMQ